MRYHIQGNLKSIPARHASKCNPQVDGGARRGWESMSVWMLRVKADGLGGFHLRTRRARLDGDHCDKLHAEYRMQRLGW